MGVKINVEFNEGKVVNPEKLKNFTSKLNGNYTLDFEFNSKELSIRKLQNAYFDKVGIFCNITGNDKKQIHKEFKEEFNISSTTDFTSIEEWRSFLEEFEKWIFIKTNIIL